MVNQQFLNSWIDLVSIHGRAAAFGTGKGEKLSSNPSHYGNVKTNKIKVQLALALTTLGKTRANRVILWMKIYVTT